MRCRSPKRVPGSSWGQTQIGPGGDRCYEDRDLRERGTCMGRMGLLRWEALNRE